MTQYMVANRGRERGEALAAALPARAVSLEAIPVVLPGADIVIGAPRRRLSPW